MSCMSLRPQISCVFKIRDLKMFTIDTKKEGEFKLKIGAGDLLKVLTFLGQKPLKSEVALIIWVSIW